MQIGEKDFYEWEKMVREETDPARIFELLYGPDGCLETANQELKALEQELLVATAAKKEADIVYEGVITSIASLKSMIQHWNIDKPYLAQKIDLTK